ncbi:hypothetical protein BCV08_11350 [Vibrio breoganii]|uniref:hypothetical protein n=1 Tax=Vibrio breoganii TaxID=553239 RepID=UPI000C82FB9A|nr:hypothetical protein [Vibrio breoganii]PMF93586.1 hypothetical protein BCV08_11350 [Vibrio breoganii]
MNNDRDKTKRVGDVIGSSFEEHLAKVGKQSKQSSLAKVRESNAPSYGYSQGNHNTNSPSPSRNRTPDTHYKASSRRGLSNPNSQKVFDEYHRQGQSELILRVWSMLMQAFDSKMKHYFGEEPDTHFMRFAAELTPESFARLKDNLLERLDEDREWPPSLVRLKQLANSPTKEVMYQARQRLFHAPVPMTELDRVELFVKKHKMREVRSLPERNFEHEFNRKYIQWFRDVIFNDMDIKLEEKQRETSQYVDAFSKTEHDQTVDKIISEGRAFYGHFGSRIQATMDAKAIEVEELSDDETERLSKARRERNENADPN